MSVQYQPASRTRSSRTREMVGISTICMKPPPRSYRRAIDVISHRPVLEGSLLRHVKSNISGMTVPWVSELRPHSARHTNVHEPGLRWHAVLNLCLAQGGPLHLQRQLSGISIPLRACRTSC